MSSLPLAYRTTLWQIDSVVFAATRAKAKAATIRAARNAGYNPSFTTPMRVVRAPELDGVILEAGRCVSPDYAKACRQ